MSKTTIQVDTETRDQLAALAAEQGTNMGALIASWAAAHPTREQREAATAHNAAVALEAFGHTSTPESRADARARLAAARKRARASRKDTAA
jgi:conjugal transfer/entry exclusion protein